MNADLFFQILEPLVGMIELLLLIVEDSFELGLLHIFLPDWRLILSYSIIIAAFAFEVLLEGLNLHFFLFNEPGQLLKFALINAHMLLILVQHFVIIFKLGNHVLQLDILIV